jgi:anhydro-N-acetylmuramic acid kinase
MTQLAASFEPVPVHSMAVYGIDPKAIEAMAFALLAYTTMQGEPNNVPQVTGAGHTVMLGKIIPVIDG